MRSEILEDPFSSSAPLTLLFTMAPRSRFPLVSVRGGAALGVDVEGAGAKGRFEGCDISMRVHVAAGADPFFTRNKVSGGFYLTGVATKGRLEHNDVIGEDRHCLFVGDGADPTVTANLFHSSRRFGIVVTDSKGVYERNSVFGNALGGVQITNDAEPVLRCNRIYENLGNNVGCYKVAKGCLLLSNAIFGGASLGVRLFEGATPRIESNFIYWNAKVIFSSNIRPPYYRAPVFIRIVDHRWSASHYRLPLHDLRIVIYLPKGLFFFFFFYSSNHRCPLTALSTTV